MKYLRILLFPVSIIYAIIIAFKNLCYKIAVFKAFIIPKKSIVVGNLSMGGTGKSPMVSFLIDKFSDDFKINALSRGYGRKTKGFFLVNENDLAESVGDEPLMYKKKFKEKIEVAVCEARKNGILELLKRNNPDLFIFDDAFQHRKVKAGFSILLSDYAKPFYEDFILPLGNLREFKAAIKRANLLVITKCPENLDLKIKKEITNKIQLDATKIFFSHIKYGDLIPFDKTSNSNLENLLLVTGIANPKPLEEHLAKYYNVSVLRFPDHHNFNAKDMHTIHKKFDIFAKEKKGIVTTEKDFVRISNPEFSTLTKEYPWYYQPITIKIDREEEFLKQINEYVRTI